MRVVLADIGGTHARFAILEDGAPGQARKMPVADYESLPEALREYCGDDAGGTLYMATAAWPYPDGTWRFARPDRWVIETQALEQAGWKVGWIGNDFAAGARGALAAPAQSRYQIQPERPQEIVQTRNVVLGSGTGLGLAYVDGTQVQETYGGHMEVPHVTDEQHTIIKLVRRLKSDDRPVSAEDIISGPGLALLYKAVCMIHGQSFAENDNLENILGSAAPAEQANMMAGHALRLYHEFLGLFAHQAAIFGHAYAGLYLDGGVLHKLVERESFDRHSFLSYFIGDPLPLIKTQLQAMRVDLVTDPFVTLRGLVEIMKDGPE